jgi:hypothetical protein
VSSEIAFILAMLAAGPDSFPPDTLRDREIHHHPQEAEDRTGGGRAELSRAEQS